MLGADLGAVVALDAIKAEEAAGYAAGKTRCWSTSRNHAIPTEACRDGTHTSAVGDTPQCFHDQRQRGRGATAGTVRRWYPGVSAYSGRSWSQFPEHGERDSNVIVNAFRRWLEW